MSNVFNDGEPMVATAPVKKTKPRKTASKARSATPKKTKGVKQDDQVITLTDVVSPDLVDIKGNCMYVGANLRDGDAITQYTNDNVTTKRPVQYYGAELGGNGVVVDPRVRALLPIGGKLQIPDDYIARVYTTSKSGILKSIDVVQVTPDEMTAYLKAGVIPVVNLSDCREFIERGQVFAMIEIAVQPKVEKIEIQCKMK